MPDRYDVILPAVPQVADVTVPVVPQVVQVGVAGPAGADGDGTAYYGQVASQTPQTFTGLSQGVYVPMALTAFTLGDAFGFQADGFGLKNVSGSTQLVWAIGSVDSSTGNNRTTGLRLAVDGVGIDLSVCQATTGTQNFAKLMAQFLVEVPNNQTVTLQIANVTGAQNVTVQRAKLVLSTVGRQGEQGVTGATGAVGPVGPVGPPGVKGDTGDAATVDVGTVTVVNPDVSPDVSNSGTTADAVLDFDLPRAPAVSVGTTATVGPADPAAVTDSGVDGDVVLDFSIPQGVKGDTGDAGEAGPPGATGEPGVVISPTEPDDQGVLWADTSEPGDAVLPVGGTVGQSLVKVSGADYDTDWATLLPAIHRNERHTKDFAAQFVPDPKVGLILPSYQGAPSFLGNIGAGFMVAYPQPVPFAVTVDEISCWVETLGVDSFVRLAIYKPRYDGTSVMDLVVDAGTVDASTTGEKTITLSPTVSLTEQVYWLVASTQGTNAGTVRIRVRALANAGAFTLPQTFVGYAGNNQGRWGQFFQRGTTNTGFPDPVTWTGTTDLPRPLIGLRVATIL